MKMHKPIILVILLTILALILCSCANLSFDYDGRIAATMFHFTGVKDDGTLIHPDSFDSASSWSGIKKIANRGSILFGLKEDGSVITTDTPLMSTVERLRDVTSIAAGVSHVVALKKDGTVDIVNGIDDIDTLPTSIWKKITSIAAGSYHTVGLRKDGTVVATGDNSYGQCNVEEWNDITAICASNYDTVGLKKDGTVITTGYHRDQGLWNVSTWDNIIAVAAGGNTIAGVTKNGIVIVSNGREDELKHSNCDYGRSLKNVCSVAIGHSAKKNGRKLVYYEYIICLKKDGTIATIGYDRDCELCKNLSLR